MTIGLTRALAAYIAQGPKAGIELQQAQDIACMGMMDAIAVAMAAGTEMVTRVALERARSASNAQDDGAPIWFSGEIMPTPQAAFVNGVASHALDYDDVALSGHPSTALTPAIMAMAHALQASGEDCLRAYVVGYEVWAELVGREPDPYHIKGWHPTAVFGTVAATAALAYLRRFNEEQVTRALAISASLASGVVANFGTMTKPLHSGRVAALAFEALELASLGLTAAYDALEHHAGFLAALSPHGNVDRDRPYVCGAPHILSTGLSIKKYPVCYSGHRVIDAVIDMANKENIDAANIDRIIVGMGPAQASMLRNAAPVTELEAKFSAQFAVAAALVRRKVGLAELNDAFVNEPAMRALYSKISVQIINDPDPEDPAFSRFDTVEMTLKDGQVLKSGKIYYPRGHAHRPLTEADLKTKVLDCLTIWKAQADVASLASYPIESLYEKLAGLKQCSNVRQLFRH